MAMRYVLTQSPKMLPRSIWQMTHLAYNILVRLTNYGQHLRRWGRRFARAQFININRDQLSNMSKIELRENTKRGGGQSTDWLQASYTFAVPPCVPTNCAWLAY